MVLVMDQSSNRGHDTRIHETRYCMNTADITCDRSTEASRLNVRQYATALLFKSFNARPAGVLLGSATSAIGCGVHIS